MEVVTSFTVVLVVTAALFPALEVVAAELAVLSRQLQALDKSRQLKLWRPAGAVVHWSEVDEVVELFRDVELVFEVDCFVVDVFARFCKAIVVLVWQDAWVIVLQRISNDSKIGWWYRRSLRLNLRDDLPRLRYNGPCDSFRRRQGVNNGRVACWNRSSRDMKDGRAVTRCGHTNRAQTVAIYFAGKKIFCACCGEDGSEEDS